MLDKRCRHKIREVQSFYLFRKHGYFYYAFYPQKNVTKSTGELDIQKAYYKAWDILGTLTNIQNVKLYTPYADKKRQRDLKHVLTYIDQTKTLTSAMIQKMQKQMQSEGLSGKSINNYVYILRKAYTGKFPAWEPVEYTATYRSCFPIKDFYGFWQKCNCRLHYLAFFTMTTGCRLSEIVTCEDMGNGYLKINGTKTKNAVRIIPVLPETVACLEYLRVGFKTESYKDCVIEAGRLCGFDRDYIEANQIKFHSFRKMYKTLLVSANINTQYSEYLMGHSQTRTVNQLYFVAESMDRDKYDEDVRNALKRFL